MRKFQLFIKRTFDIIFCSVALVALFPLLLILTVVGAVAMRGNPFFIQPRPGKKDKHGNEKIFNLIKFRTMSNKKGEDGELLPDGERLNRYGRFLRAMSLDELPEILNILKGDMSIVGPRPLAVKYLPFYTDLERERHSVRPGLTGLAQVSGRNSLVWEEKFEYDLEYVNNVTFNTDVRIILKTVGTVFKKENIGIRGDGALMDFDTYRKKQMEDVHVR